MDSVSHFDDIQMRTVAEGDGDSVMDVTPHAASPSRRSSFGESAGVLWSTPLSGISGLTGGRGNRFVQRAFVVL
jgi:hypothetical protein